ncbi:hypothetical protein [Microvirga antarctica]|uniref:hypothetical protein n=1 Tax=Microvirga antarctica TaxID=2819233 RepID=UPI001B3180BA|nr:hypothetical protein [Microvirga antarctica]
MFLTADEVHRSLRGTVDLLHSKVEGLQAFDMSERGFWHSFAAILLTLPAYVITLALERIRLGYRLASGNVFDGLWIDLVVGLGHVAGFLALPMAMIFLSRALGLTSRYVPFVVVTNWIAVASIMVLSFPSLLLLIGWATPALAGLFTFAFCLLVLRVQWFATKLTLGVPGLLSLAIVSLGLVFNLLIDSAVHDVLV